MNNFGVIMEVIIEVPVEVPVKEEKKIVFSHNGKPMIIWTEDFIDFCKLDLNKIRAVPQEDIFPTIMINFYEALKGVQDDTK